MSTALLSRPCIAPSTIFNTYRRTFFANPFTATQNLAATRVLPYPSKIIFQVITDVPSYKHFIPYCQKSEVYKWSNETTGGKRWPEEAKLLIGFGGLSETFWSRVYCVPEKVVETVAGSTDTSLPAELIKHHNARLQSLDDPVRHGNIMKHLSTKWELRPVSEVPGQERTEVNLKIDFAFSNPVYDALSAGAKGKVADKMIEAFEERVKVMVHETSNSE